MRRHGIPTAEYRSFVNYKEAREYILSLNHQIVIKACGLAGGKGVILPPNSKEALISLTEIMVNKMFGKAGAAVVIEEFLEGDEISIHTFCDGVTTKTLPPGQDHKRAQDHDRGLNTGGMGVYTPTDFVTENDMEAIESTIIKPTIDGLMAEGTRSTLDLVVKCIAFSGA